MTVHYNYNGTPGHKNGMHVWICDWCNAVSQNMHDWYDTPKDWVYRFSKAHRPYKDDYVYLPNGVPDQYAMRYYHDNYQFCCQEHADLFEQNCYEFFKYPD